MELIAVVIVFKGESVGGGGVLPVDVVVEAEVVVTVTDGVGVAVVEEGLVVGVVTEIRNICVGSAFPSDVIPPITITESATEGSTAAAKRVPARIICAV